MIIMSVRDGAFRWVESLGNSGYGYLASRRFTSAVQGGMIGVLGVLEKATLTPMISRSWEDKRIREM